MKHMVMLQALYYAPGQRLTATQVAQAAGYKGFAAANLQMGLLARNMAERLGCRAQSADQLSLLVTCLRPGVMRNTEWLWVLRPELSKALKKLGWVRPSPQTGSLRLVTWNCCMGAHRKLLFLAGLRPDVSAVQECAKPAEENAGNALWAGSDPREKGLMVSAGPGWTVEPIGRPLSPAELYLGARVTGRSSFALLAVWAKPVRGARGYVRSIHQALDAYANQLSCGDNVVMGDFNSHPIFKHGHDELAARLEREFGLVSAYHAHQSVSAGAEKHHGYYHHRDRHQPFHIDYCFVPKTWVKRIQNVSFGGYFQWTSLSDHVPLIVDLDLQPTVSR
jgi:exodeoxyribonuclease III